MKWKSGTFEVIRFLLSGGGGFALYYVLALAFRAWIGWSPGISGLVATLIAILPTFLLQRAFTFRSEGNVRHQFAGYGALQVLVAILIGSVAQVASIFEFEDKYVFLLAGFVGISFSYMIQKLLIFRKGNV